MNQRILIRVDASSEIGYGHLTRCCAFINSINNTTPYFYSVYDIGENIRELCHVDFQFDLLQNDEHFLQFINENDLIVIDGYQFDSHYLAKLKKLKSKVIHIDDLAKHFESADLVINPTPGFTSNQYSGLISTQYFLGLDYALLRTSFQQLAVQKSFSKIEKSLLICFGGSDPLNKTAVAYQAAVDSQQFNEIHIVLGNGYTHEQKFENTSRNIFVHHALNENRMAALMAKMEYGIIPSSGILLECLAANMKVLSGYYIDNQIFVYREHMKLHTFVDAQNLTYETISSGIENLLKSSVKPSIIDGNSSFRISKIVQSLQNEQNYSLRLATINDTEITYQWANDPAIRKFSFNHDFISLENHIGWFSKKINSSACFYFIMTKEATPIGSIRFDIDQHIATISYLLAPTFHGKGLGTILLKKGLEELEPFIKKEHIRVVQGYVLKENSASIKLFERFGFQSEIDSTLYLFKKNTFIHA
jgi:UDP-2,4-diacetamido-2,4,6-trideoxy-beta-L-altropyranose hydrolase